MKYLRCPGAVFQGKFLAIAAIIFLISSAFLAITPAQARSVSIARRQAATSDSVTILILDMSGSMAENDPQGYRCSAANAFIDMSGPGNQIGVIGLDGDTSTRGAHNFALAQQWTAAPIDMSALSDRTNLKAIIQNKSRGCAPDSITPTYDALSKALQMLEDSALKGGRKGSVVLLTDGQPDDGGSARDIAGQVNAITTELLPQFHTHSWPIDTIALGQNAPVGEPGTPFATFHDFLHELSSETGGKPYDDGRGIVPGLTPLNIAPFFTDIFARHNNRTPTNDIGATPLSGDLVKRNFNVVPYTDHLDIIVVKDQENTSATLFDPNGNKITRQAAGVFIYLDRYYVIFSIDGPPVGLWELDVRGAGQFLMEKLNRTTLQLSPLKVSQSGLISTNATPTFASGQPLTIKTVLTNKGSNVNDPSRYTVRGTIRYNEAVDTYNQDFGLHTDASGTYVGTVTVPDTQPTGSYEIKVQVSTGSLDNPFDIKLFDMAIGTFPIPLLLSQAGHPTKEPVTAQSVQWDAPLSFLYNLPLPGILSQWALQGHPARQAVVQGQVTLHDQAYSGATLRAFASRQGASDILPVTIQDEGNGKFSAQFLATGDGLYTIHFTTSGALKDSHGDFGNTQNDIQVMLETASLGQEIFAWFVTVIYLLLLVGLYYFCRFLIFAHPFGGLIHGQDGVTVGRIDFKRARRNLFQSYIHPDLLYSRQVGLPPGLIFRFKHRGGIEVRLDGTTRTNWQEGDGGRLSQHYHEVRELRYSPADIDDDDETILGVASYAVKAKFTNKSGERAIPRAKSRYGKKRFSPRTKQANKSKRRSTVDNYDDYDALDNY